MGPLGVAIVRFKCTVPARSATAYEGESTVATTRVVDPSMLVLVQARTVLPESNLHCLSSVSSRNVISPSEETRKVPERVPGKP